MALAPAPSFCTTSHGNGAIAFLPSRSPTTTLFIAKKGIKPCPNALSLSVSRRSQFRIRASSSGGGSLVTGWDWLKPAAGGSVSVSDVVWPSAGAFLAMALLGRLDQAVASRGLNFTIAPLGAVCAVLFAAPNSPAAQKYNIFIAQIGCAAMGVLAFSIFGPGWLARATALAASMAFMIITRSTHPPAASLPILFIDGTKLHHLNFWYVLFPGAAGCVLLCIIQEMVDYLRSNYKF